MPKKAARASFDSVDSPGDASGVAPPAKKPRKPQSRVKGRKGALKVVMTLPLDLIFEICTHLEPGDLYALSNTSKAFRQVVTGEPSAGLFKKARERVNMPELKATMPDLRYAALFFGKGCNICGKKNAGKVDPSFRARICTACLKNQFVSPRTHDGSLKIRQLNHYVTLLAPHTIEYSRVTCRVQAVVYHWGQLEHLAREIDTKFPHTRRDAHPSCFTDEDDEEWRRLSRASMSEWNYCQDVSVGIQREPPQEEFESPQVEFLTWFAERQAEIKRRREDANALDRWMADVEERKSLANANVRNGRREEIESRLVAIGFDRSELYCIQNHPLVKSTRPLSDRTWSSKIEFTLCAVLREYRLERVLDILDRDYTQMRYHDADGLYFPSLDTYYRFPIFAPIAHDLKMTMNPPPDWVVPDDIRHAMLREVKKHIRDRRESLVRAIVDAYLKLGEDETGIIVEDDVEDEDEDEDEIEKYGLPLLEVRHLPLKLPRLPPWIPRKATEPIVASDEQLSTFLENSKLAQFECESCRKLFDTPSLFSHLSSELGCRDGHPYETGREEFDGQLYDFCRNEWRVAKPQDEFEWLQPRTLVRIDVDVLRLSLQLDYLVELTPLRVHIRPFKLPDVGRDDNYDDPTWYKFRLECDCRGYKPSWRVADSAAQLYYHLRMDHQDDEQRVKPWLLVEYSHIYRREYELRRATLGVQTWDSDRGSANPDPYSGFGDALYDSYDNGEGLWDSEAEGLRDSDGFEGLGEDRERDRFGPRDDTCTVM